MALDVQNYAVANMESVTILTEPARAVQAGMVSY